MDRQDIKKLLELQLGKAAMELLSASNRTRAMFIAYGLGDAEEFINKVLNECAENKLYNEDLAELKNGHIPQRMPKNE